MMTICLSFEDKAEEAVKFYTSVFRDSKTGSVIRYNETVAKASGKPVGAVLAQEFEVNGQRFMALNSGPETEFNQGISLIVKCDNQEEVDYFSRELAAGGGEQLDCGWLKDKYGVSWQITPKVLLDLVEGPDSERASRAMDAMVKMKKIDIAEVEKAAVG